MNRKNLAKQAVASLSLLLVVLSLSATSALADGGKDSKKEMVEERETETRTECITTYGGETECREVVVKEKVVHVTKDAGLEDLPFMALAGGFGVLAITTLILSKATHRVYWLE